MNQIVLNANMGDAILNRLKEFTDLPAAGYVAGQAVASAVSELFGDGRAVQYNDVDVFREFRDSDWVKPITTNLDTPPRPAAAINRCTFGTLEREWSQYHDISETTVDRYKVMGTRRNGMLNEVLCEFSRHNYSSFLETFDLNCVQVGVDLATKQLFWTPQFEMFNRTRELDVVTLHTPFHSLIRYFRKKEELGGVHGNDERIIEMLAAAYHIEVNRSQEYYGNDDLQEYSNLRWRFGRIYREKLEGVAGMILPHFSVETEVVNDYPVSRLVPRFTPGEDLLLKKLPNLVHCLPKLSRALREKHSKGTQDQLNHLASTVGAVSVTREFWLTKGSNFISGDATPAQIQQMDKVADEHKICHHLDQPTLTLQWEQFERFSLEAARRGNWVYSVLEHTPWQTWTDTLVREHLDAAEARLTKPLVRRTLPSLTVAGFMARELVSGLELYLESNLLPRGVERYSTYVRNKRSRIITFTAVELDRNGVTMELRKKGLAWVIGYVYANQDMDMRAPEKAATLAYRNYSNLAVCVGGTIAGLLARTFPSAASIVGAKLGRTLAHVDRDVLHRKLCQTISGPSVRLAKKLDITSGGYGFFNKDKKRYLNAETTPFAFWATVLPALVSQRLHALFHPREALRPVLGTDRYRCDEDDIPF